MIYADTSFLVSLYLPDANSPAAHKHAHSLRTPFPWTPLHDLECSNAIRLAVFRREITLAECDAVLHDMTEDQRTGILRPVVPIWDRMFEVARDLSRKHTPGMGTRSLDLLHVAAAKALHTQRFFTFDARQGRLASRAGLHVVS